MFDGVLKDRLDAVDQGQGAEEPDHWINRTQVECQPTGKHLDQPNEEIQSQHQGIKY